MLGETSTVEEVEEHAGLLSAATADSSSGSNLFDVMSHRADDEGNTETARPAMLGEMSTVEEVEEHADLLSAAAAYSSGAANLFDGLSDDDGNTETVGAGGEDRIGTLPDEVLSYLMSFLPSRGAVQTCVLAKRWRTLWKSVPALRSDNPESSRCPCTFVDQLICLRDPMPLNVCDISSGCSAGDHDCSCDLYSSVSGWSDFSLSNKRFRRMEPWLHYAVSCQVEVLRVCFPCYVDNMTLISSHLRKLQLCRMEFEGTLDFSSCQVLEVLELNNCQICANISSKSLQHLNVDGSTFDLFTPVHISAPNLIGFRLAGVKGLAPFLDSMPSLVTASIALGVPCIDRCSCGNRSCEGCDVQTGNNECSVLVKSLSGTVNLELTTTDNMFVFRNYLKCYPLFGKLKTLLLNEWCMVDNCAALVYFLHHSPILETLTLQLDFETQEEPHVSKRYESYNSSVPSIISKHLKVVKIICDTKEDAWVHHILKILRTHGVASEQIDIQ